MLAASIFVIGSIALFGADASPLLGEEYERGFSSRIKRDASDFPSFVDNMAKTARVVTAITVQNGLIDGSMKSDEVLGEMMNVGLARLEELQSFDVTMVANFVQELTNAVQNLGKDPDLIGIQNDVINMQTIKDKLKDVADPSDLPDKPQFEQLEALNNLDTGGLEDPNFFNFDDAAKNIRAVASGHGDQSKLRGDLKKLRETVEKVDPKNVAYGKLLGTLEKISKLEKYVDVMKFATSNEITHVAYVDQKIIDTFTAEFEVLREVSSVVTDFDPIDSFVSGQMNLVTGSSPPREHAPGFVNGFRDLESLSRDLGDQWLQGNIGTKVKLEGLAPLISMKDKMKQLAEHWEKACTSASLEAIRSAARMKARLGSIGTAKANLASVLNSFKNFRGGLYKTADEHFGKLMSASMKAYRKMKALKAVSDEVKQEMTSLDAVISGKKDEITTIVKLFDKLKPQFDILHEKLAIKECYPVMAKNMDYVTNFDQHAKLQTYKDFFKNLKETSNDLKQVAEAMEILKEVRSLSTSSLQKLTSVANTIAESSTLIAEVRALPKSLKSASNEETKTLKKLDLRKESKKLGDAVAGVVTIQKAVEKISLFQGFAHGNTDLKSKVSSYSDLNVKRKIQREWGDFEEVDRQVQLLIKGLEEKTMNVGKAEGSKISAYGPLFEKMIGLRDTDLKTGRRLEALETFIRESKLSTLEQVAVQLKEISLLDLKFSRFDSAYSGIAGTLERVGKVLGHSPVKVTSTPIPNISQSPHLNRTDNSTVVGSAAVVAEDSSWGWMAYAGIALGCLFILAVIISLISYLCRKFICKKKNVTDAPSVKNSEKSENESQTSKRVMPTNNDPLNVSVRPSTSNTALTPTSPANVGSPAPTSTRSDPPHSDYVDPGSSDAIRSTTAAPAPAPAPAPVPAPAPAPAPRAPPPPAGARSSRSTRPAASASQSASVAPPSTDHNYVFLADPHIAAQAAAAAQAAPAPAPESPYANLSILDRVIPQNAPPAPKSPAAKK